ncbi:MAG: PAS domain S-box protein [Thermodesulfobacteriota bacterium]
MEAVKDYIVTEEMYHSPGITLCRGIHQPSGKRVVPTILSTKLSSPAERVVFRHELNRIQSLPENGVLKILDVIDIRDKIVIIREDFDGILLNRFIRQAETNLERLLALSIQLASIIHELHQNDIIHKGIRPGSFFISPDLKTVKVANFGIEDLLAHDRDDLYHPTVLRHLLPYISPEQTGRMNRLVDHRTDLYSLGALLFELFSGQRLFMFEKPLELFYAHMAIMPPALSSLSTLFPGSLSDIVMKLLAKEPSDRYQSCYGLKCDLEECLDRLQSGKEPSAFTPAARDRILTFTIPQKIYGRKAETGELRSAYNRVSRGATELFIVSGSAGIGKSALVHEFSKEIHRRGGHFACGKFDQIKTHQPYQIFIQAFQQLVRRILVESEERLQEMTSALKQAVGLNGKIITDAIPEFEIIIGKQPDLYPVDQEEAGNRFKLLFLNVCRVFADSRHPLFLFLDDLQWADPDSMQLLRLLLQEPSIRHLLVAIAFRAKETAQQTRLSDWLEDLAAFGIPMKSMELEPLDIETTRRLVAETLQCEPLATGRLPDIIHQKTSGNPFFLKQFLSSLYEKKLILFNRKAEERSQDAGACGWVWDIDRIDQLRITDNVVEYLLELLTGLDPDAVAILKIAACIGPVFDLETLSAVCRSSPDEMLEKLNHPVKKRIILADQDRYTFIHERIREAVISLLAPSEKKQFHYGIGVYLSRRLTQPGLQENLFAVTDHLNQCLDLISDHGLRSDLIHYNLTAARAAKQTSAHESAQEYFHQAVQLLPDESWRNSYALAFEAHIGLAECRYLTGDFAAAEALFQTILRNTTRRIDKAAVYSLMILLLTNQNRYAEAIELALKALLLFQYRIPEFPSRLAIIRAFLSSRRQLRKVGLDNVPLLPEVNDPEILALMDLLARIIQPAYFSGDRRHKNLMAFVTLQILGLSLQHGNAKISPYIYESYATILAGKIGDYKTAFAMGQIGVRLNEDMNNLPFMAKTYVIFAGMVNHWRRPAEISITYLEKAITCGIETGDLLFTANALTQWVYIQARSGKLIASVLQTLSRYRDILSKSRHFEAIGTIECFHRMLLLYQGGTDGWDTYSSEDFDERDFSASIQDKQRLCYNYYRTKVESLYVFGFFRKALEFADRMFDDVEEILFAVINTPEYYFYHGLTITALYSSLGPDLQKKYRRRLGKITGKFRKWAAEGPDNYQHQYSLLRAEILKIRERNLEAVAWYRRAIQQAHEKGYLNHEAVACECAARFYEQQVGDPSAAAAYTGQALFCYRAWGAAAKCEQIQQTGHEGMRYSPVASQPTAMAGEPLDIDSIFRFTEVISSEIQLNDLLEKLIKIVLENAGANRGLLLLLDGKELFLEAEAWGDRDEVVLHSSLPISQYSEMPHTIIQYARRTAQTVVTSSARNDLFAGDSYLTRHSILSVLCLPIVKQQQLKGLFYLENTLMTDAFPMDRVKVVQLLSTHAATALENALLFETKHKAEMAISTQYEEIQRQYTKMESINQTLRRTQAELLEANKYLSIFKMFADETGQGFGMADLEGNLTYVNRSLCRLIGHDAPEQAYGSKIFEYHPVEIAEKMKTLILPEVHAKGQWIGESVLLSRRGEQIPIIQNLFRIPDLNGKFTHLASVMTDITDRKNAEKALRESEARHRILVDTMNEGLCVLDLEGTLLYVNKALCDMTQYNHAEIIGRSFAVFMDAANAGTARDQLEARKKGLRKKYELEILRKDGQKIQTIVSPQPIYGDTGELIGSFGIVTDITDKKRMETELLKASKLESLGVFAGGIAHDFNNLLTAILGKISISKLKLQEGDELLPILTDAEKASVRAKNLTHQLLTFSKGGEPLKKVISIIDILRETADFVLSGSNVSCEYRIDENIANIEADPGQISQVIHNLVINARQSMPEGGVIHIQASNAGPRDRNLVPLSETEYVHIRIIDQGGGIRPKELDKIFDPYFTTKSTGTGLGLSISYSIIKKHGGHILASSEVGRGSAFDIYLPATGKPLSSEQGAAEEIVAGSARILIMDDDDVILDVASEMLLILGHTVDKAHDGEEALARFGEALTRERPYDLLIMDLTIPGKMGGREAIGRIRQLDPHVKAVVSSGYSNDPIMANYRQYGFNAVLAKPYLFEEVKRILGFLLSGKETPANG